MAIAWYFKRSNLFSFGIAWFFVALLPRVTLVPSADIVGDYKTFFASIGMLLMLAGAVIWVIDWLLENVSFFESRVGHTILVSLCMWLALSLIGETKYHCTLWGDHVAFWEYVRAHVPRRAWAAQNLGVALASADRVNEALDCYQDAVRLDPQYVQPLVKLGESCQKNGETARALAYYARAEGIATDSSAELHNNKGLLFFGQGDLDRAEEEFKKALALQPRFANCLFNYANVLKKLGRFSQAYLVVNERIRCSPHTSDEHVQFLKARLAFEVCEYRDVVATLEPCIKKTNDVGLQFMLAASYYNEENYKKAAEWFEKVYAKRPDNLDVAYNYGQSLLRLEKYSAAIPFFQQCAGSEKYPFAQLHAAACLYRNGNHSAARTSILALDSQSLSEPVLAELSMLKQDMRFLA